MIKRIVLVLILASLTYQGCSKGCLKCNVKDECIFCDISSSYYLSSANCTMSTLTNCLTLNTNGDCVQCGGGYYLDSSTKKCVAVETAKVVTNCALYGAAQACVKCASKFFISSGKCTAVTKLIDNCDVYSDDGKCASCAVGYLFNAARDGCVASPNTAGCSAYTFLKCNNCASGYISNPNLYFTSFQTSSITLFNFIRTVVAGNSNDWTSLYICQKIEDANCLVASSAKICTTCKAGYFLTSTGTCRAYPKPIIEACQTYSSLIACSSCLSGYYLESATKCTLIAGDKLITDCTSYNPAVSSVQCIQCATAKYLNSNTCTSARSDSLNIDQCKTTSVSADTCAVCNDGYVLTGDSKKCLTAVANCKTYGSSTTATTTLTCSTCNDEYYLTTSGSTTSCTKGTLEGCLTYSSSTVCTSCNAVTGYYLSNSVCKKHVSVSNCASYDPINFNQCAKCNQGFYPFKYVSTCTSITVISNCVTYSSATICSACASGYYLQSNTCKSINDNFANCISVNVNGATVTCTGCKDGFALNSSGSAPTCAANHNYILDQCDTPGSGATFDNSVTATSGDCLVCKENSFPFDLSKQFACISNTFLATKGIATAVTNCKQYSNDSTPVCVQCPSFVNIADDGTRSCVTTCDKATKTQIIDNLDGNVNTCATTTNANFGLANCALAIRVFDNAADNKTSLKCLQPITGRYSLATLPITAADSSYWRDAYTSTAPTLPVAAFLFNGYGITSDTGNTNHDNGSNTAQDCEIFFNDGANSNAINCLRCKWGYSVTYKVPPSTKTGCAQITGCNTNVVYSGFSQLLNQVLSCHACTDSTKALLVILRQPTNSNTMAANTLADNKTVIQCVTPGSSLTESTPVSVANCLVYGYFFHMSGTPAAQTAPTTGAGCLACQPGTKPTYAAGNVLITACTTISGCDSTVTQVMANRCTSCTQVDGTGAVEYKAFNSVSADTCVVVTASNCLFSNTSGSSPFKCRVCKPGYWLNHDAQCERISLPLCADSTSSNFYTAPGTWDATALAEYYALKKLSGAPSITGCDTCLANNSAIRINSGEKQCALSPYVQANSFVTTAPVKYITDCAKYNNNLNTSNTPVATCKVCKNNKIPTADGKQCVTNISNCASADNTDATKCSVCNAKFQLISGGCVAQSIANCDTYDATSTTELLCSVCAATYVLATNKKSCYAGNVVGCSAYATDNPWSCTTCLAGYARITTASSGTYCFKIDAENNCDTLDSTNAGLQGKNYKCLTCTVNNSKAGILQSYATSDATIVQSLCLSLNPVDKCVAYDTVSSTVGSNGFLCTECSDGFFVDTSKNLCTARTNLSSNCATYEKLSDKCNTCNATSFLNDAKTDCISFPNGILGCATYSNDTVCTSCNAPRYLGNNTCTLSTTIDKCATYSANYTCTSCTKGYFLTNATYCQLATATNCYTYTAINTCEKCDPADTNKGLKTDTNGVTSCVDKNVANCDLSTNSFPFTCTQCKKGYYIGADGSCAVATPINKCLLFDSASTCTKCEQGSVLSVDRKSCNDSLFTAANDANCADSQLLSTPACSQCTPGSYFSAGNSTSSCVSCSNNTYASGCFTCDPTNQTACFACKPGYYQTASGACVSLNPIITPNTTTDSHIQKILALLLVFMALLV